MNIRESQIEDIFVNYPEILQKILSLDNECILISRQKILPSQNRTDLIFLCEKKILLIELKVTPFKNEYVEQLRSYLTELVEIQNNDRFIGGEIIAYLLCTSAGDNDYGKCTNNNQILIKYSLDDVLTQFQYRLRKIASFIELKPINHGLWNIHLLNRLLYISGSSIMIDDACGKLGLSKSTINSYLSLAKDLMLIKKNKNAFSLSKFGIVYYNNRDKDAPFEYISEEQSQLLQDIILTNPFRNGTIFGIYCMAESVFNLMKNTYPVPHSLLVQNFKLVSGRYFDWNSEKTANDSVRMYSNYCIDLGLLGRIKRNFYLTPNGIRFILLLNLHKSIKIVDSLGISKTRI